MLSSGEARSKYPATPSRPLEIILVTGSENVGQALHSNISMTTNLQNVHSSMLQLYTLMPLLHVPRLSLLAHILETIILSTV